MSDIAIKIENLSKKYRIGANQARYQTLRESITGSFRNLFVQPGAAQKQNNTIWALKDIDLEIKHGEVLGIIGRNGAGKSTLLKILARITKPTTGRVELNGRVGSLLEVGTGFHPELTGRENIYLSGAILGMHRKEIAQKFDEIVAFSEIEKFLDTQVKHYSSGMYMRLAFAVAAHLEPEILLVDEVLAVGDAEFQKKCLGKMGDVAHEGRTVLFVSHNMGAVSSICKKGVLLESGHISLSGTINEVIRVYMNNNSMMKEIVRVRNDSYKKLFINKVAIINNEISSSFFTNQVALLRIEFEVLHPIKNGQIAFELLNDMNECIFSSTSSDEEGSIIDFHPGNYYFDCPINLRIFREGRYLARITSSVPGKEILDIVGKDIVFDVVDNSSPCIRLGQNRRGLIFYEVKWKLHRQD